MTFSQKCQYALRATFELARRVGLGPTPVSEIAAAQAVPPRFLELILRQLRQGGFVESRRGARGGYLLVGRPQQLSVGQIIRFIDGPLDPVSCATEGQERRCPLYGSCAFLPMWKRARDAVAQVYDTTSFQDLIDDEAAALDGHVAHYSI